jgi:hypothetical protein
LTRYLLAQMRAASRASEESCSYSSGLVRVCRLRWRGRTGDEVDAVRELVDAGLLAGGRQCMLGARELDVPYRPRS